MTKFMMLAVCLCLGACVTQRDSNNLVGSDAVNEILPNLNIGLFEMTPVLTRADAINLSAQQQDEFFQFFEDVKFQNVPKHQRVATYLGLIFDQFTYSERTLTAQQSLELKTGNCLSLTMITTALAELAEVKLSYQLLDQNPVYSINNNLLITSNHLRAVLKSEPRLEDDKGLISHSFIRIDYFRTDGLKYIDNISTEVQMSLFYSNLAIESLSEEKMDVAFSYAYEALKIDPNNSSALNVLGILHRKKGDLARAEEIYRRGAKYFTNPVTFVNNYKSLLASQSREADLDELIGEIAMNPQDHPWSWVRAGRNAYNEGNFENAISYYRRAIDLAPDIHQVYAYAGAASYAAGYRKQSRKYMLDALAKSVNSSDRAAYKGKLKALKNKDPHH